MSNWHWETSLSRYLFFPKYELIYIIGVEIGSTVLAEFKLAVSNTLNLININIYRRSGTSLAEGCTGLQGLAKGFGNSIGLASFVGKVVA
jgi:hypothetical protein